MARKKRHVLKFVVIDGTHMDENHRARQITHYNRFKATILFLGEFEFEHLEAFNLDYARSLCNTGIVMYAELHGITIPDNVRTRGGVRWKIEALENL